MRSRHRSPTAMPCDANIRGVSYPTWIHAFLTKKLFHILIKSGDKFGSTPRRAARRPLMFRSILSLLAVFLVSLGSVPNVNAQGWGWEGWGGWTSTPEGSLAQGMGHYYQGRVFLTRRRPLQIL